MMIITIAKDFSATPGGRYISEGEFSGEAFREQLLKPYYEKCIQNNEKLIINMDGCFGFAPSFLEEAFGGLAREKKTTDIMKNIVIIHEDEPGLVERIEKHINKALLGK